MSHQFLSEQWIEAARDIRHRHADSVPHIEANVRINVVTTKVPFGEGTIHAYIDTTSVGGCSFEMHVHHALAAAAGRVDDEGRDRVARGVAHHVLKSGQGVLGKRGQGGFRSQTGRSR